MTVRCLLPLLPAAVLAWGFCQIAWAQNEATLLPGKDNTLYESDIGTPSNGAGAYLFAGKTRLGFLRRALLAFDVAGALPAGATIDSVKLVLHHSRTVAEAQPVTLHRVLADWGEGASDAGDNEGQGAEPTAGDATWLHTFFDTGRWQKAGGDFLAGPSAGLLVGDEGPYRWGSTPEMVADVRTWLDAPAENFGWILLGNEDTTITVKRFDSRENPDPTVRPVLHVFYALPTALETEEMPASLHLAGNYPNPFRQTTTITYVLDKPRHVTLEVYDVLGRKTATLVEERQEAGRHQTTFDAGGLPEGVYHYRLSADGLRRYRKMIVLR